MALNKTMTFDLELKPGGIPPIVHASQGDIGRMFKANIYWDGSAATSYISGATVNLRGRKPDKTVFDYSATLAGSMVTFETTEQMTIISGPVECELVFSNDGDIIASANFVLIVEDSPYDPNNLSESEVEGLTDVLAGFQRLNRDSNGVVKIGDGVTASGTAEPIKGFYVHDEETDTDGIAKFSSEELEDIRVGADGVTYPTAGDAVRRQNLWFDREFSGEQLSVSKTVHAYSTQMYPYRFYEGNIYTYTNLTGQPQSLRLYDGQGNEIQQIVTYLSNNTSTTFVALQDAAMIGGYLNSSTFNFTLKHEGIYDTIYNNLYKKTSMLNIPCEIGTITGGMNGNATDRVRTAGYLNRKVFPELTVYNPGNNTVGYAVLAFDEDYNQINDSGWLLGPVYSVPDAVNDVEVKYWRLIMRYYDDHAITDMGDLMEHFTVYNAPAHFDCDQTREIINQIPVHGATLPKYETNVRSEHITTISYDTAYTAQDTLVTDEYIFASMSGLNAINVYDRNTGAEIASMPVEVHHGNSMQFGEYYAAGDQFPLIYVGGQEDENAPGVSIVRVVENSGTWTATLIRTLKLTAGYALSPAVDAATHTLYAHGFKMDRTGMALFRYDLDKLTLNGDGTYTPETVSSVLNIPIESNRTDYGVQSQLYYAGKIYWISAFVNGSHDPKLHIMDAGTGVEEGYMDLTKIANQEFEGVANIIRKDGSIEWYVSDFFNIYRLY